MPTFDIVSKVNIQEVDNAINQTRKEVEQRYDFKGGKPEVIFDEKEMKIQLEVANDTQIKALVDVLDSKLVKRGISLLSLKYGKVEQAGGQRVRQAITVIQGIDKEKAKELTATIKKINSKIQSQIMDEQLRVSGKNRDDLQEVIQSLKSNDKIELPLQFINFRD